MLPLYLFIVYETLSSFINTLPPLFLSSLTEPSDLLTSYNLSFITKGPSDPGRRLPLTTSAGWLGRCPGVQCSSTHSIDKTTLAPYSGTQFKIVPDTVWLISFTENVPQEIFARG